VQVVKAVRFHVFGGPEVLRYEDVDRPVPGAGQVRVRVTSTSFNPVDSVIRGGSPSMLVQLPHVPGVDVAGVIDTLGPGVDGVAVGDRVVGLLPMTATGAAAEHVLSRAEDLAGVPRQIPLADLGALPLVGLTAWQAVFDHGALTAGQRVLLVGADTAVGGHALQLAQQAGAQVIATFGPTGEAPDPALDELVPSLAGSIDLLVALTPLPVGQLTALLPAVRPGGTLVNAAPHAPAPSDPTRGVRGLDLVVRRDADQLADLVARVATGELIVDIAARVDLVDLADLHARADTGDLPGKVLVRVPSA